MEVPGTPEAVRTPSECRRPPCTATCPEHNFLQGYTLLWLPNPLAPIPPGILEWLPSSPPNADGYRWYWTRCQECRSTEMRLVLCHCGRANRTVVGSPSHCTGQHAGQKGARGLAPCTAVESEPSRPPFRNL